MNKLNIFSFDLDDTLLNTKKGINDSTRFAIDLIHRNGDHAVINTGRHWLSTVEVSKMSGITKGVQFNGAGIYDYSKKEVIWTNSHKKEDINKYLEAAETIGAGIMVYMEEKIIGWNYSNKADDALAQFDNVYRNNKESFVEMKDSNSIDELVEKINGLDQEILKYIFVLDSDNKEEKNRAYIQESLELISTVYQTPNHTVEISPKETSKIIGLKELKKIIGKGFDQVTLISFGDNYNDVPALKDSDYSVAMENSPEPIKKMVDYVTGNCDEDGILEGVEHYYQEEKNEK